MPRQRPVGPRDGGSCPFPHPLDVASLGSPRTTAPTHGRCRGGQPGPTEDVLHTPASAETAIEDMLSRQVDFNEIEDFIERLPISEEHRSALWLWAWSSQPPRRLDAIQLKKHAGSR